MAIEYTRSRMRERYHSRYSEERIQALLKDYAGKYIHGADIETLLYKIAKSYMALIGDGKSNIFNLDTLLPFSSWPQELLRKVGEGKVDVIMTNPPFGTKIDDTRKLVLEQFNLGRRLNNGIPGPELLTGQDPDKLFLERDIQLLAAPTDRRDGGRMVIVLPRQNLSGTDQSSVELRKWLVRQVRILAVVDLPREAFLPHTGTKTSLVFLQKDNEIPKDYEVFMAVSEVVGHDRRGSPLFERDDQGRVIEDGNGNPRVLNDLPQILEQLVNFKRSEPCTIASPSTFSVKFNSLTADPLLRLDAWYWDPNKNDIAKTLEESVGEGIRELTRLGDLVVPGGIFYPNRHTRNYVDPGPDTLPFYSSSQILHVRPIDVKHQPLSYRPAAKHVVNEDWILITRSGTTGRVVIVNGALRGSMVSEHAIRVIVDEDSIDPYYLYAFLASEKYGRTLLSKGVYASVVDHISPDFVASLPIPRLSPEMEAGIAAHMRQAESARAESSILFGEQVSCLEKILDSEASAD